MAAFECECIGSHKFHALLKLGDEKIDIIPNDYSPEFILSIRYKSMSDVQILTSAQVSSFLAIGNSFNMLALTAGVSIISNMLFNKPKLFLVLTFKDERGILQSIVLKTKKPEEVQNAIYDKIELANERSDIYGRKLKLCPYGHENSPTAKECWVCGAQMDNQKIA